MSMATTVTATATAMATATTTTAAATRNYYVLSLLIILGDFFIDPLLQCKFSVGMSKE